MIKNIFLFAFAASLFVLSSCDDDDPMVVSNNFTVTIENVTQGKDYFNSGVLGPIPPGMSETFSFNAGKGHYFQFATMFVQTNDVFFAPSMNGIALYDASGAPLTGDISASIMAWDAGTEINEEPGAGPNQAPRQAGPNEGLAENGVVRLLQDVSDGFIYPSTQDLIQVVLNHDGGTLFTVTINNISNNSTLPTPISPGTWVVHFNEQTPMFTAGTAASEGVERIAEDGDNAPMDANLSANSGLVVPFSPGAFSVGTENSIFTTGQASSQALEAIAEDGDPSGFTNVFNTPAGASSPAPIFPGQSYTFSFTADEGDKLSFATMFIQSNDWFVGFDNLSVYTNSAPLSGDLTNRLSLYDGGTEADEYPGAGNNQAPRQAGPDTGTGEAGNIELQELNAFNNLPTSLSDIIRVTIEVN